MGQRHQAYIIARLIPHGSTDGKAYYRCIGGVHHQWCYGSLPLLKADHFITLVKNNPAMIREELKSIQGQFGRFGQEPTISAVPCPYLHFLLASAFNIDLDTQNVSGGKLAQTMLPAHMGCWDGDNNDGLTILDVTDPLNPSYAFISGPETDSDLGDLPCTARDYLEVYYPDGSDEENDDILNSALTAKFDSVPFLTEDMLAEAWPREFGAVKHTRRRRHATRRSIPKLIPEPSIVSSDPKVPALSELVVEPAVARSLELGDTSNIELLIPGKTAQIKAALCALSPFPETGLPLLLSIVQEELKHKGNILDLTGFSLSPEQLASVAAEFPDARTVILSHSPQVRSEHVRALLSSKPNIDHLELMNTGITNDILASLLQDHPEIFKRVSDIIHPLLVATKRITNPGAFHVFASSQTSYFMTTPTGGIAISVWTPAKIVQNICGFLAALHPDSPASMSGNSIESMVIQVALSSGTRAPDTPWKDRTVTTVARNFSVLTSGAWTFMFNQANPLTMRGGATESRYAFAKVLPGCTQVQTYDLGGFLEEMRKEGRGPLPNDELVKKFNDLIKGVKVGTNVDAVPQTMSSMMMALINGLSLPNFRNQKPSIALFDNDGGSKYMASFLPK
ncbi:hypothetical protein BDP27DRAFT_1323326 [Rhodocollybia butyracea]|uniref:Uncharacterized protein n=1 Tax=Rhodocollybia butyracea TaxID=206335 RepID=A0A9P5PR90_9AGAR|nr:hypothetical protein BDP27DRAFT_1323326 [Rhodocollybia butyracea]